MKPFIVPLMLLAGVVLRGEEPGPGPAGETVVLLHGLGLRSWAMNRIARMLRYEGYTVLNLTYPSRTMPIEELAASWLPAQLKAANLDETAKVNFVTHSMGGIILRLYRRDHTAGQAGRVVMLGPPNNGSEVVDHMRGFAPFRWFTGINGVRLGTDDSNVTRTLGPWPENGGELGIIAGDASHNPIFSAWLAGPNDGRVSTASARLAGMTDFVVLHHSHTWLQWRADTCVQVLAFLRQGRFEHTKPASAVTPESGH